MSDATFRPAGRALAAMLALLALTWGACLPATPPRPTPGLTRRAALTRVPVPGGLVDTRGGNLLIRRSDLSLDTPLGTQEIRASYNSASGRWLWNFQMRYDGERLVDPTGAVFDALTRSGLVLPDGTVFGTSWVRVDADTIRTRGGRAYHFRPDGSLSHVAWATLDYPRIVFTATQISQCTQATTCTPLFDLVLDAEGRPLTVTDARTGRVAAFDYDAWGRLVSARSPRDVAEGLPGTRYEYTPFGTLLRAVTNSEGERVEYEYQAERRILHVTRMGEGDPRHRFEFYGADPERWVTVHTNPLGGVTRYQFDRFQRLREVVRPGAGEVRRFRYGSGHLAAFARPASVIEPDGAETRYRYSIEDDVVEIVEPSGNVVLYAYRPDAIDPRFPFSRPTARIEDSLGRIALLSYDAQGRPERLELADGGIVTSSYGPAALSTLTFPLGDPLTFAVYGAHGHWTEASFPQSRFPIRRAFDPVGNSLVPAAGLQEGGVLDRSYDPDRRIVRIHVAASEAGLVTAEGHVEIERRSDGRVVRVSRPRGADHIVVYDDLGRPVLRRERVDGAWHDTSFAYDAAGNLVARERPNGMREEFSFDAYGRLVGTAALRSGVLEGEATITYAGGRPRTFWDSRRGVTETYHYDAAGRLARIGYSSGESLEVEHDLRSRLTLQRFVLPGGASREIRIAYDAADRPTRYELDGGELLAEHAYRDGKRVRTRFGNGLTRHLHYDPGSALLVGFTTEDAQGAPVEETTLTRSILAGPQRYRVETATTTPLASTVEGYDFGLAGVLADPDRRVGNRVWGWDDGAGSVKRYVYDELSNLRSNEAGDVFAYNDEANRLLAATLVHEGVSHAYVYDEAGFVVERDGVAIGWTATGKIASYGPVVIEWDMVNRPLSVSAGGLRAEFALFGGMVARDPVSGAVGNIDLGFASVPFSGPERVFRHRDFRRNVRFTSDETGRVVSHHRYSAYAVDAVFGEGADTRRFAGAHEIGDGLVLMGWRVYDSHVGRFLSPDPLLQELNQYAYTLGNPVDFVDARGLHAEPQAGVGEHRTDVTSRLLGALLATLSFVYAVGSGAAVGAVVLAGAAALKADWDAAVAIDAYWAAKARAEGAGGAAGSDGAAGPPPPPPRDLLDDVRTASGCAAGDSAGSLGVSGVPRLLAEGVGGAGLAAPAGCGDAAPYALVDMDPRGRGHLVAVLLCLHLLGAAIVLRARGKRREG